MKKNIKNRIKILLLQNQRRKWVLCLCKNGKITYVTKKRLAAKKGNDRLKQV